MYELEKLKYILLVIIYLSLNTRYQNPEIEYKIFRRLIKQLRLSQSINVLKELKRLNKNT